MQIFNTTLKTTIQARVTAATAATTLKDLMVLAKAARGLGIDTANLETLINNKLNTLNGSSTLTDLMTGALASGAIPDTVGAFATFTTVKAGDPMWVDVAGRVFGGDKYRIQLAPHKGTVTAGVVHDAFVKRDGLCAPVSNDNNKIGFSVQLSDGFILLGDGDSGATTYGFRLRLLSPDLTTVVNANVGHLAFINSLGAADYYAKPLAVYKMPTANTYRVYFRYVRDGETTLSSIGYYELSYNTSTQAVTIGARVGAQSTGSNAAYTPYGNRRHVTERYVILKNELNNYFYVMDLQANTLTEIVAARGLNLAITDFMGSGTDWCAWARQTGGSAAGFMVKADGTTVASPASLTADGGMSGGANRIVIQIAKGVFLVHGGSAGLLKVIVFNASYTTVNGTSLIVDPIRAVSNGNIHVVKNGLRFYVIWTGVNFSFEVSAANVVSGFRWEDKVLKHSPPCFDDYTSYAVFDITETWHYLASFGVTNNAAIFSGPLTEFMKQPVSALGVAMTDAAGGSLCMVALDPKVQTASGVTYDLHRPFANGYTRQVETPITPIFETVGGFYTGTSAVQSVVEAVNTDTGAEYSVGPTSLFTLQSCHGVIYGADSVAFSLQIASPMGKKSQAGTSAGAGLLFKSEYPVYMYNNKGSSSTVRIIK